MPPRFFVFLIFAALSTASPRIRDNNVFKMAPRELSLRLMSLNTWNLGGNVDDGRTKIAKHIELVDADIVGIQVSLPAPKA